MMMIIRLLDGSKQRVQQVKKFEAKDGLLTLYDEDGGIIRQYNIRALLSWELGEPW